MQDKGIARPDCGSGAEILDQERFIGFLSVHDLRKVRDQQKRQRQPAHDLCGFLQPGIAVGKHVHFIRQLQDQYQLGRGDAQPAENLEMLVIQRPPVTDILVCGSLMPPLPRFPSGAFFVRMFFLQQSMLVILTSLSQPLSPDVLHPGIAGGTGADTAPCPVCHSIHLARNCESIIS